MVGYAILGTSFISGTMVSAVRASDDGVVQCVAGRSPAKLAAFAAQFDVAVAYTDYMQAVMDTRVDVVYIGLPTYMHAEWVARCARAGKHVLVEKSFALCADDARLALEVVRECGVFCMEAQMYRCHPIMPLLKAKVDERPFGAVLSVDAAFTANIIHLFNRRAGGSILDLGCYPISCLRFLFGEPVTVTGSATIVQPDELKRDVESPFDVCSLATVTFPNDVVANVRTANNEPTVWTFNIRCERGVISLSNLWDKKAPAVITLQSRDADTPAEEIVVTSPKDFYALQIDLTNQLVAQGRLQASSPAMDWADSINNMRALDAWRAAIGLQYSNLPVLEK